MYRVDEFIHDGLFYDIVNRDKEDDILFYRDICLQYADKGKVCEACCGTGRVTIPLAKSGINISGFDASESMLTSAKKKADESGVKINLWKDNLGSLNVTDQYDLVICPFNSLQYFYSYDQIFNAFSSIRRLLVDDGILCFDVFNPRIAKLSKNDYATKRIINVKNNEMLIEEKSNYRVADQVISSVWTIYLKQEKISESSLDSRCYFPQELEILLRHFGFDIIEKWGDFSKNCFCDESSKQIVLAKKKGGGLYSGI